MGPDLYRLSRYERVRCPWCGLGVELSDRFVGNPHGALLRHLRNMHSTNQPSAWYQRYVRERTALLDQHFADLRERAERQVDGSTE